PRARLADPTLLTEPALLALPGAATEPLAGLSVTWPGLVEALLGGVVTVLHALAVLGVVLPLASVLSTCPGTPVGVVLLDTVPGLGAVVHVVGEVVRSAGVDIDVAAAVAPVAVAPERRSHRGAGKEGERAGGEVTRRVGVIRWIGWRPGAVDDRRGIARHRDHLRVRGLDPDHGGRGFDLHRGLPRPRGGG